MSLSRSEITVMLRAADRALPAFAATENQRWDSLSAVARDRRGVTLPLSRFQTCASTSPSNASFPASIASAACSSSPRTPPPLPTGPYPLALARRARLELARRPRLRCAVPGPGIGKTLGIAARSAQAAVSAWIAAPVVIFYSLWSIALAVLFFVRVQVQDMLRMTDGRRAAPHHLQP